MGGSSPHTRGARQIAHYQQIYSRIIPAYAGSTCEERHIFYRHLGSSPHTRGARPLRRGLPYRPRIIPAYAGSTSSAIISSRVKEDHPRIRGEHMSSVPEAPPRAGSSPHTRGAPQPHQTGDAIGVDHPRIRGEHAAAGMPSATVCGSSPHTRGALTPHRRHS